MGDLDNQIMLLMQDLPFTPLTIPSTTPMEPPLPPPSLVQDHSNSSSEDQSIPISKDTRNAKEEAWCRAVIDRPIPKLNLPRQRALQTSPTSPQASSTMSLPSPNSSTGSRRSSGGTGTHLSTRTAKVHKVYRLDMRNKVIASLWKALQDLSPG